MEILNENRFACRVTNNAIFALAAGLYLSPMQIIIASYANEEVRPPVLLPDAQNCTRNLPVGRLLPRSYDRAHLYALLPTLGNVNETDALATRFSLVEYFLISPRFLEAAEYKRDRPIYKKRSLS